MKYRIYTNRTITMTQEAIFEVEAENEEQAKKKAIMKYGELEWESVDSMDSDYHIEEVHKI